MESEDFKKLVAEYIGYDSSSGRYSEKKMEDLARRFGAPKFTMIRWATVAGPHRHLKPIVIEYILDQNFKEAVVQYIGYSLSSSNYDKEKAWKLCGEFEVAESTVIRWITGTAKPHPLIKQQVVDYIRKPKDFKEVVAEYIEYKELGLQVMWSEEKVRILADEFEAMRKTVVCWANGLTNPRKGTKELVVRYINAQKK